jgi:ATP-dependent Clp protease ATP-binding subunit ClpC
VQAHDLTGQVRTILALAREEATRLGHGYFGAEHLLLGLLAEAHGIAAHVLIDPGVTLEKARAETMRLLGSPPREDDGAM